MARRRFPDESSRMVWQLRTDNAFRIAADLPAVFYAGLTGPTLADIRNVDGTPVPGSQLTVDKGSGLPDFDGPDGDVGVVYVSVNGGPRRPVYASTGALVSGLTATVAGKRDVLPSVTYLDVYNSLFGGVTYQTGQATVATTLSASVAAGATTVTVASAAAIVNGMLMVVGAGTASQQMLTVTGVAGTTLTVSPALALAWPTGTSIAPVWLNTSHITADSVGGSRAYGYWLANAKKADGSYVFTGAPKVVWLGDSWTAEAIIEFGVELAARLPGATAVNAGVPGNKLSQMIARFGTDVTPQQPTHVVLEYGVNDIYALLSASQMASELEQAVALCRSIGAQVIIPGIVPLIDYPSAAYDRNTELKALASGPDFPSVSVSGLLPRIESLQTPRNSSSIRLGSNLTQPAATGLNNIAVGAGAQQLLTTGVNNTAIGQGTQTKVATTNYSTAVGQGAQLNMTGGWNTGLGALAQFGVTTGGSNTAVGYAASYQPNGLVANASTTANFQTAVGYQAGAAAATQDDRTTAIGAQTLASGVSATSLGSQATANGNYATALGSSTQATAAGAVAIGRDSAGAAAQATTADSFVLGTSRHSVQVPGRVVTAASASSRAPFNIPHGVAPTTPTDGDMWTTTAGLFVRINGVTVGPLA